jgi:type II secretion system protein C
MELINMKFDTAKIITVVNGCMGVLILVALGFFIRNILMVVHKKDIKPASPTAVEARNIEKKTIQHYDSIFQINPFGVPAGSLKSNSSVAGQAGLSDMKLIGTISGNGHHGYAIFIGGDGKQSLFQTGESVFGAGELKSVERYFVYIENNGKLTKIPMVDIVAPGELESLKGSGGASGPIRSMGKGEYIMDQKAVQYAMDNPTQIMTDAKLIPNMVRGKQEGFTLREVRKNGLYDSLGMQNGDVLLRVNNFNISSPESALQAFTALKGMDKVQLDIMRNNNRMTMNYQIR